MTCRALEEGRQIVLLRKGGLQDEDGVFSLEYSTFWLQPTYLHQDEKLVKPAHRDLFGLAENARQEGENKKFIALRLLARAERVWRLAPDSEDSLRRAPHIWSDAYLDVRFDYKPERPLLCVALRVFAHPEPHVLPFRPEYFGCRSWIEMPKPMDVAALKPVLEDAVFAERLRTLEAILHGG